MSKENDVKVIQSGWVMKAPPASGREWCVAMSSKRKPGYSFYYYADEQGAGKPLRVDYEANLVAAKLRLP